jgi:hypothetical protein
VKTPPSSRFSTADLVTAVHLAGGGASAREIAEAIGRGMTTADVYSLLHRYGVRLTPKARGSHAFVVVVNREAFERSRRAPPRRAPILAPSPGG